jgi:hypothetical protein
MERGGCKEEGEDGREKGAWKREKMAGRGGAWKGRWCV